MSHPDTIATLRTAARAAADKKAFQIVGLQISALSSYADGLLICSGGSDRQVADVVIHVFTEERRTYYGLEGLWGDAPRLDAAALEIQPGNGS
jgi:ribosome-associated protein